MALLTLQDLTEKFLATHPSLPAAMYRTTANHLARLLGQESPATVVLTHTATALPAQLEAYLRNHAQSSPSKVRNNKSQALRLIRWGIAAGLIPGAPGLSPAWQEMWARKKPAYGRSLIGKAFVVYCSEQGITPQQLTAAHFHAWRQAYAAQAMQQQPARSVRTYMTHTGVMLRTNAEWFPRLVVADLKLAHPLRLAFSDWPAAMQQEWHELEAWLIRPQVLGRRTRPWTPVTVQQLRGRLGEVYGFLLKRRDDISTLQALLSPEHLRDFLAFQFDVKQNSARSILSYLSSFRKALEFFRLPTQVLNEIHAALPAEDLEMRPIPRHTIPPYELLAELPTHVERAIAALEKALTAPGVENRPWKLVRLALLWRIKLVFLFLLHLSWRISNITQLRRGTVRDLALYQAPTCRLPHGLLYQDPRGQWRFFFPASATKNGRVVQGAVPAAIVPTLTDYLTDHWPRLRASDRAFVFPASATKNGRVVQGEVPAAIVSTLTDYLTDHWPRLRASDPSFVFPNSEGRVSGTSEWCNIVKAETFRYLRTPTNPHKFRHAFAFYYLTQRPEDYLTLSRYLWHRSVEITIHIYGGFEPEDALRHIEAWRAAQGAEPTDPHGAPPLHVPGARVSAVQRTPLAGLARQRK